MGLEMAWNCGRIAGIPIRVHWSFVLVLALLAAREHGGAGDWREGLATITMTLMLFGLVLLHELGHALTAQHLGVAVADIVLLPVGGVARLMLWPTAGWPRRELLITLAGPAVNLALALLLTPLVWSLSALGHYELDDLITALSQPSLIGLVTTLWLGNLALALFNLLPIFPMDGGRIVRALLATRLSFQGATYLAVIGGQALALVGLLVGLWSGRIGLIILMAVLIITAGFELVEARRTTRLLELTVADLRLEMAPTVAPWQPLTLVNDLFRHSTRSMVVVIGDGRVEGIIRPERLAEARSHPSWVVADVMEAPGLTVAPNDNLLLVLEYLGRDNLSEVPVSVDGRYYGVLTMAALQQALFGRMGG